MITDFVESDTSYLVNAILESKPVDIVADACQNKLDGETFNYIEGGFIGGTLLNVSTAVFAHRRMNPEEPTLKRALRVEQEMTSFIGKTLVRMFDETPITAGELEVGPTIFASDPMRMKHFCNEAEAIYMGDINCRYPRRFFVSAQGEKILYRKYSHAPTAMLLHKSGARINKLWAPPGTISAVDYREDMIARINSGYRPESFLPLSAIQSIAALRLSVFAIPREERHATFQMLPHYTHGGLSVRQVENLPSMDDVRDLLYTRPADIKDVLEVLQAKQSVFV